MNASLVELTTNAVVYDKEGHLKMTMEDVDMPTYES